MNAQSLALIAAALWLTGLSVLSVQVVKALGAVMLRLRGLGSSGQGEGLGPAEGMSLSEAMANLLAGGGERHVVVLLSSTCAACFRVAGLLADEWRSQTPLTVVVNGDAGMLGHALGELPPDIVVRAGVEGAAVHRELERPPVPFVVVLDGNRVIGTGLLSDGLEHLWRLLELTEQHGGTDHTELQAGASNLRGGSL